MTTQTEFFPKTELDEATTVLDHLIAEQDKADKAVDSAQEKQYQSMQRAVKQRHVVARLQAMMPAVAPDLENEADGDVEEAEVLELEGDVLDPITGEVQPAKVDDET